MGICNVTPDSFSDGGLHFSLDQACAHVDQLLAEGADVIDIGGESTRPGAQAVPAKEQLARVLEVVRHAAGRGACVSIDTTSAAVAAACLDAGASVVNDVSCLRDAGDGGGLAKVVAAHGAAYVLMHARATQSEMKGFSAWPDDAYGDVVEDVLDEWSAAAARAQALGVPRDALVMDPGLGFAKNARHSTELLRRTAEIVGALDVPVLVGASRKSFLALGQRASSTLAFPPSESVADKDAGPQDRVGASIAAALLAARAGAAILRVHDVRATRQAIDLDRLVAPPRKEA